MKIALDPWMTRFDYSLDEMMHMAADIGYEWIEFAQRDDFWPYFTHPTANDAQVQRLKRLMRQTGVGLASCLPLYRWADPDEDARQAAVRYWMRAIDITVELGCDQMNSEFTGDPAQRERSEAQFWKSMDVIIPRIEKEGIKLNIEPHPNDFIERGVDAIHMIRAINHPNVGFLYCVSHAFHQEGTMREVMEYAGPDLKHLHISDTFDHRASRGNRYILNPPGTDARVHQHLEIGDGEIDFENFWQILDDVKFDGIATVAVFSQEDKMIPAYTNTLKILTERLPKA